MKKLLPLFLSALSSIAFSQEKYNDLPVIRSSKPTADYRINDTWSKGNWGINADLSPDVMEVPCFSTTVDFAFYTDKDSIRFPIRGNTARRFYVLTSDGKYALTEIRGYDFKAVKHNEAKAAAKYTLWYENNKDNAYLQQFAKQYHLHDLVKDASSDSAKALRIMHWVHQQWQHNGSNEPVKKDAISILEEVKEGKNFRCVEYGIVTTAALNAIGIPARVLGLKTKDVETTASGAGHVLLEVYLRDMNKWALLDGQFDVMPLLNGIPLNAVEFQNAIANNYDKLELRSLSGEDKASYVKWVYPYLYYFDIAFDNREGIDKVKEKVEGKSNLMLVPLGAKQPAVFQVKYKVDYMIYTNSISDFYAKPW